MICALSGQLATTPVVSPKSGAIFEKKLIESYIATAGKDPISEQPLEASELVVLRTEQPAYGEVKPPVFNSIPTMLQAFQNEWDALALETFQLRKYLSSAREDLSSALYKYDAAVRVIARLTKERDDAREALTMLSESIASAGASGENVEEVEKGEVEKGEVKNGEVKNGEVEEEQDKVSNITRSLSSAREILFQLHKKTKFPFTFSKNSKVHISDVHVLVDMDIQAYAVNGPSTEAVVSGASGTRILSLTSHEISESSADNFSILSYLSGPENVPFGACGTQVKFIHTPKNHEDNKKNSSNTNGFETGEIHNLAAHPSEPFFVAVGQKSFDLCDSNGPIAGVRVDKDIHASDLHVDGTLFGVSQENSIDIYDVTTRQKVSEIAVEKDHTVTKVRFALNGYWLVAATTSGQSSSVVIFDLRKNSIVHTFSFAAGPTDFVLDPSCQALVTSNGDSIQVHLYTKKGKTWHENVSDIAGELKSISLASAVEQYQTDSVLKVCGLQQGKLVQYEITFPDMAKSD